MRGGKQLDKVVSVIVNVLSVMQVYEDTKEGRTICSLYDISQQRKLVTLVIDPHTAVMKKRWEGLIGVRVFLKVSC